MKPHPWQLCLFEDVIKSLHKLNWSEKPTSTVGEDKIKIRPRSADLQSSFHLAQAVLFEHLAHLLMKVDDPIPALRFRVTDSHLASLQIDLLPLQTQKLITP